MAEVKETIGMDTLDKIDIRVGTIKLVEDVEVQIDLLSLR